VLLKVEVFLFAKQSKDKLNSWDFHWYIRLLAIQEPHELNPVKLENIGIKTIYKTSLAGSKASC
jgi:hypothetical protein